MELTEQELNALDENPVPEGGGGDDLFDIDNLLSMDALQSEEAYEEEEVPTKSKPGRPRTQPVKNSAPPRPVKISTEPGRISAVLPAELNERLKNYVQWEAGNGREFITVNEVIVEAIADFIQFKEDAFGGVYPVRTVEIKRGRRPKAAKP